MSGVAELWSAWDLKPNRRSIGTGLERRRPRGVIRATANIVGFRTTIPVGADSTRWPEPPPAFDAPTDTLIWDPTSLSVRV